MAGPRLSVLGAFTVSVIAAPVHDTEEVTPHGVEVSVGGSHGEGRTAEGTLSDDERAATPRSQYFPEFTTPIGHVTVEEPGVHTFTLRAIRIIPGTLDGVTVFGATLRPVSATESQALFARSEAVFGQRTWSREDLYDRGRFAGDRP